jgi:hypothetical protein
MVLIQQLKANYSKEIMTQYFNYGYNEESFKSSLNQMIYDQSRNPEQPQIFMYEQYLEQQA